MNHIPYEDLNLSGEFLCDVELVAAQNSPGLIGSPWGATTIAYIDSGEFDGPGFKGRVLPGGGDWPTLSNDGENTYQLNVRAVWETDDGARIFVQYYGFIDLPKEKQGSPTELAQLDSSDYYFRTAPVFRTDDPRYLWLNKVLCVGIGRFTEAGLGYRIYQLG